MLQTDSLVPGGERYSLGHHSELDRILGIRAYSGAMRRFVRLTGYSTIGVMVTPLLS